MIILGLDFETTGLDARKDDVIEAGLVQWHVESRSPVRTAGFFVQTSREITEEITRITGITKQMLEDFGLGRSLAFETIKDWMIGADAICAHNWKEFDKLFLDQWSNDEFVGLPEKPWLDTRLDLPVMGTKLIYMAAEHGFVNPFPHRAVTDVLTMLRILDQYDIPKVLERSQVPNITVAAIVSYEDRAKASGRGYHWKKETKQWLKSIKQDTLDQEKAEAGFPVVIAR